MNIDGNEINENTYCNNEKSISCVQNNFQIFSNDEFGSIRTVIIDDDPWFVGKDVANSLGYKNTRQALATNVMYEDKGVHAVDTPSGIQNMTIINESGLYALIFSSKLDSSKQFKHWVTSEVLPTIRKTGGYINNEELMINTYFGNLPDQEKFLIKGLLTNITSLQNSNKALKNENNKLTTENEALTEKCLEWADRPLINALVRAYATSLAGGYGAAWNKFKKELLYKYNIGLNARISNYEKETGRKPKILEKMSFNPDRSLA